MRSHRLDRLARLTQGTAILGLGLATFACQKDSPIGVNSPPQAPEQPSATAPPTTASAPEQNIHINAIPVPQPTASQSSPRSPSPVSPPHVNALPPQKP